MRDTARCRPARGLGEREGLGPAERILRPDQGDSRMQVLETDYRLFIILYLENTESETKMQALALYGGCPPRCPRAHPGRGPQHATCVVPSLSPGRIPQLSSPFLRRFEGACKRFGLDPATILPLKDQGGLPSAAYREGLAGHPFAGRAGVSQVAP